MHEAERLAALRRYDVLDTSPEAAFDRIVRLARQFFEVPIALISFVDADRQWFKARIGMELSETPRAIAFCNTAIQGGDICQVPDATRDPRFAENPLVLGEPRLRFYAGAPLLTPEGHALGTLCILDAKPRPPLDAAQAQSLRDLAAAVMAQLELRHQLAAREAEMARAALRERLLRSVAETPTFRDAIEAAMTALREDTHGVLCLVFRLAPDGHHLQMIGAQDQSGVADPSHLARLRALPLTADNTAAGAAIRQDRQIVIRDVQAEPEAGLPDAPFAAACGLVSMIVTPLSIGAERYCLSLGFGAERQDLEAMAERLREAAVTLRPLLRRLRDAEETALFRRMVEASSEPVVISHTRRDAAPGSEGAGLMIRYVNAAFLQQSGFREEEVLGQPVAMLTHADADPEARRLVQAAIQAGHPLRQQILHRKRDGSPYWVELNISPLVDETGWHTHWMAIQRDITEQRAAEAALSASEAAFRDLFHLHPAPMWVYDKETLAFLEVNEATLTAYGWTREQFLGMTVLDLPTEADRAKVLSAARQLGDRLRVTGPWPARTASGEIRQVQILSRLIDFRGRRCALAVVWDLTERLRAEAAVRELAEELDATFQSISDGLCTLDHDWKITSINSEAERLLRRQAGALPGRTFWDCFPDMVGSEVERNFRAAVAQHETRRFIHHLRQIDTWFDITAYPARNGLTIYFRDITAEHRREERLRLLEVAASKLNDIILITEAEPILPPGPRTLFVNQAFERLTGYATEEIIGISPRFLQGPKTSRAELDRIHAALAAWRPIRAELLNYRKDGSEFWLELDIVPVADGLGHFTHWVAVQRDITERKRAQLQLEQQAALLDQARDAILVRGIDHRIQYWNRSAEGLYGWTAEEAAGRSVLDLLYDDPGPFLHANEQVLAQGEWSGQIEQRRKDGSRLVVDGAWTLVRDAEGRPRAILAVNTNITERLELEQKLRQSQRLEAIGQLTGGVAHDFNNLLTVILGNSEMLAESLEHDAELRQMAEMNIAAAERGSALTSRMLAFSRRQALDPKVIDVNGLLAGLHQMLHRTLGGHIEVEIEPAEDLWTALIDPPQLENAVLNLCINARDAMPKGGRLVIETANVQLDAAYAEAEGEVTPGDYVLIAVSDTGTGMTPEVVARAFEPFFTTKDVGQGSGLGLSMVFGFMKQSGGHVKIYSEPGLGTSVKVYVPRAGRSQLRFDPGAGAEAPRGGTEKLLVVEDDPLVRDHVAGQLRELGYRVVIAGHAAAALEALRLRDDFDLLLTDVVMPGGMNGHALAQEALRIRPGLRVLYTTGYTEDGIVHDGRLDPDVLLLKKPYRRRDLAEKVRQALDAVRPGPAAPPPARHDG
ncbi:PAS domain S-box protein [Falsiroseomonas tokyonensis]|uniref:histidine kinase n=1 Tax=Falsiroseomonas tokyonensis TaxID=430521 RepID=A0ABV7C1Z3_9PROT|nr:PAS domain S-box protein [Falsiroseomonas tokyonensis]MBU8540943.1 PAS domain S-box protein [Falsiroseomonas tokyonensis]